MLTGIHWKLWSDLYFNYKNWLYKAIKKTKLNQKIIPEKKEGNKKSQQIVKLFWIQTM